MESLLKERGLAFTICQVEPVNWNKEWESSFRPVTVTDEKTGDALVHIRASFHPPFGKAMYELEVNPKMSFGTGHHATTRLMMQAMGRLDMKGKRVVDFGTGTGILAILAEKMGSSYILASDCDPGCMENSKENFKLNGCQRIEWLLSDVFPATEKPDIILANINLNVILQNIPSITAVGRSGTEILFSGILKTDEDQLVTALTENKIINKRVDNEGDWIVIYASITH